MSTRVYFLRVFKYLFKMAILLSLVFAVMLATSASESSIEQFKSNLQDMTKGSIFLFALLAVALAYPKFGYAKRTIQLDMPSNRDAIISMMDKGGYTLYSEEIGKTTFRATSPFKRILMLGDDKMIFHCTENLITIDGVRKDVSLAEYRLKILVDRA